ncbi:transglutaminase family protein [Altererythrobacter xixiisoli]|uniref:Transglutaminase family protein n=2 Tax=Croceibacterium xixiisoli TaxID=1476466 RepID=A0A6I4TQA9_9SPHN|nr:transglutaminase family protein [Croceibacterium xixiisoli]
MTTDITASFSFTLDQPSDVLLQFEAAAIPEQHIIESHCSIGEADHIARIPAQDDIGERIWLHADGRFDIEYRASVEVRRRLDDLATLNRLEPHELPGEAVQYLFDSRYCPASQFQPFVNAEFGQLSGGQLVLAMQDWINQRFTYEPGSSTPQTTALDSFVERRGICRDFTHVMITLARAAAIPARYLSVYDPGVNPPDFHAVAEVFLADPEIPGGGVWHIIDATRMADPATTVKIGVGRDAADVSFMTTFGYAHFQAKEVLVTARN